MLNIYSINILLLTSHGIDAFQIKDQPSSFVAQLVKNPPAIQETWVWPLDWEDPLEKGKSNDSSILAWRIPWTV